MICDIPPQGDDEGYRDRSDPPRYQRPQRRLHGGPQGYRRTNERALGIRDLRIIFINKHNFSHSNQIVTIDSNLTFIMVCYEAPELHWVS